MNRDGFLTVPFCFFGWGTVLEQSIGFVCFLGSFGLRARSDFVPNK